MTEWSKLFDKDGHATGLFRQNIKGFLDAWRCGDGCLPFHTSLQVLKTLNDMHDIAADRDCCTLTRACFDRLSTQVNLRGIEYKCDSFGHATEDVYLATQVACRRRSAEISRDGLPTGALLASQVHSWPAHAPNNTTFLAFWHRYQVATRYFYILVGRDRWQDLARIEVKNAPIKSIWLDNIKKKIDADMAKEILQARLAQPSHAKPKVCEARQFTAEELADEQRRLSKRAAKKTRAYSFFGDLLNE